MKAQEPAQDPAQELVEPQIPLELDHHYTIPNPSLQLLTTLLRPSSCEALKKR
jgi:hypothetical protein